MDLLIHFKVNEGDGNNINIQEYKLYGDVEIKCEKCLVDEGNEVVLTEFPVPEFKNCTLMKKGDEGFYEYKDYRQGENAELAGGYAVSGILQQNKRFDFNYVNDQINKIAGPMLEAWAGEVFAGIRDDLNNPYDLINVEAQERLGMADIILQFRKNNSALTGNVDVKATANDIPNSGKGPNITSFSRIRTAYVKDPDFMFIILSIKHRVYVKRNERTGLMDGIMEVVDHNEYDLKFISDADINYNPALGTGQIQIKDIHYITYQYRTTWEMCQLLDSKYLHSSRRTIDDFIREANKNGWIK